MPEARRPLPHTPHMSGLIKRRHNFTFLAFELKPPSLLCAYLLNTPVAEAYLNCAQASNN
jgi:hypothetical protein